jgi:D-beta-D-heptose 7-phosphate kinase/D-beta-D-heptose 1-phosphate adenosyltransferase
MYDKLLKTVTSLGTPRILIAGDFMLDSYIYGDALRISPEAPVPILKVRNTDQSCGGAASVSVDIADLGAKPLCLGVIGNDENGKTLINLLNKKNADTAGLITTKNRPTTCKQRLIGLAQHRHQQQLFRLDHEVTTPFDDHLNNQILETYEKLIKNVDIVCFGDYNKGFFSPHIASKMINIAKKYNKAVLVDPSPSTDYSRYSGATLITPNRQETSIAANTEINSEHDAAAAAAKLRKDLNLDAVIVTLDKQGAFLDSEQTSELVPTRPRNVYDVTGAGDMVLATLGVALAAGCDLLTSVQLANITGGLEVEKFGVASVTIEEIVNEIITQNRRITGKIKTTDVLLAELKWHKNSNRSIVFTNGCFDVLHRGHIQYLKFCKTQGDIVVLGLNSDKSVRQIKGPERPINNQRDRAEVLSALESIDYVVIFDEPDPLELIKKVAPDILIKGKDWKNKGVVGQEFVEANGGKVVLADLVKGKSSTSTIEKIKSLGNNN